MYRQNNTLAYYGDALIQKFKSTPKHVKYFIAAVINVLVMLNILRYLPAAHFNFIEFNIFVFSIINLFLGTAAFIVLGSIALQDKDRRYR